MVEDIQNIIESVVNSIDKTIDIKKFEDADLIDTKLYICGSFKWLKVGDTVLDEDDRDSVVTEIGANYIIVHKGSLFTWTSRVLTIVKDIYFFRGTPLATNSEWLQFAKNEDSKTPFVWLVEPTSETFYEANNSLERESDLRIFFLDKTDLKYTTKEHHDNVIEYLSPWVDGFLDVIRNDIQNFRKFDSYSRKVLSRFGTETPSGYESNIIDSNLSAIEIRFTLPIKKGAKCIC